MILSLFGITLFNYLDLNTLMIATMVLFLCFYEFGIGSIVFIHIFETNVDSITGVANQVLFFMVFTTSLITPTLIANLTVSGTFAFIWRSVMHIAPVAKPAQNAHTLATGRTAQAGHLAAAQVLHGKRVVG